MSAWDYDNIVCVWGNDIQSCIGAFFSEEVYSKRAYSCCTVCRNLLPFTQHQHCYLALNWQDDPYQHLKCRKGHLLSPCRHSRTSIVRERRLLLGPLVCCGRQHASVPGAASRTPRVCHYISMANRQYWEVCTAGNGWWSTSLSMRRRAG